VKLLLDTHILLWAAGLPGKLPRVARRLIEDTENLLLFSPVNLWEIATKRSLGRDDFQVDPRLLHRGLIDNGYEELQVSSIHALTAGELPPLHKDPFDRLLVAQSIEEGIALLTADPIVAQYPGPVRKV
tara:strand:+ start:14452 stop:14838 length:387 start_codon:yes stop_codon:yes gene_type:complete